MSLWRGNESDGGEETPSALASAEKRRHEGAAIALLTYSRGGAWHFYLTFAPERPRLGCGTSPQIAEGRRERERPA